MQYDRLNHSFPDSELISGVALAQLLGVSSAAVSKARLNSRIDTFLDSKGREKYHQVLSQQQFLGNRNLNKITTPTQSQKEAGLSKFDAQRMSNLVGGSNAPAAAKPPEKELDMYAASRAEREFHQARIVKLKADEAEERLVDKVQASQKVYGLASSVRDRMLSLHLKVAPIIMDSVEKALISAGIETQEARNALSIGRIEGVVGEVIRKQIIDSIREIVEREKEAYLD